MINISKENYKKYGECVCISNGKVKMLVTIDLGPRIIFYGIDGKNIMFEDLEDTTSKGGEFFDENLKGEGIWHLYGGHRLWKSPEYMDTYYPDNKKVEVVKENDGSISFVSKVETTTKLQKIVNVLMQEDGSIELTQRIVNMSDSDTTPISAWGLTVLDKKAKVEIPLSTQDTGFLPNRNIVYWSYDSVNDERISVFNDKIKIEQKDIVNPIKIGTYVEGAIKVQVNGMQFSLSLDKKEGYYPDFSSNIECYTNNHILEIETLSPLQTLTPGEQIVHKEHWKIR